MKRLSSMFLPAAFFIGAVLLRSFNLRSGVILLVATIIISVIEPVKAYGQVKGRGVTIGNEFANFVFEEPGLGLREVSGLLESLEGEGKIWQIELRSRTGDVFSLDNNAECKTSYTKSEGKLGLSWEGIDLPGEEDALDVRVEIELEKSSGLSYWSIKVENGSENWGIWTVDFPYITGIKAEGAKLAYPQFLGRLVSLPDSLPVKMIYPCSSATMQFSAVISGSKGLYLAAYDPQCYHKEFLYEEGVSYRTRNFPEEMGLPGKDFILPYRAVVGSFDGDWIDAAKIYRSWATKQKWCSKGRLSERTDIPDWFRDISLWFVGGPSDNMARLLDFLDTSIAFHWYNWHEIPFDKFYPDYFPPKEGFADKVQELQKTGIRIMPYINARLWDTAAKSWESEKPEPYTTKDQNLEKYIEHWANQNHSVMCPYTEFWHKKVSEIVSTLVGKYRVDGVYLDQIASMSPVLCFDKSHGHTAGGGDYWVEGYRKLVEKTREDARKTNPDAILTTEDHAEPFLDLFDGFLTCNSVFVAPELIPLFNYVYSGYMIAFGRYNGKGFAMKNAQMFLWGTQLGWFGADVVSVDSAEAQYLKELTHAFSAARKFLLLGEMLRPPRIEGDNPMVSDVWRDGQKPVEMPAVGCTAWKAPDGTLGLVFTNCDVSPHSIRYELDLSDYGLSEGRRYVIRRIAGNVEEEEEYCDTGKIMKEYDFQARSVLVLEVGSGR
jgi:hypothetical protein